MSSRGTTSDQLEKLISIFKIKNYKGYYSKDELKNLTPAKKESILINLQSRADGNGTHHLAVWKNGKDVRYFDSYGCPIPLEIKNYYKNFKLSYLNA